MSKGAYCLIIHLNKDRHISVGALGKLFFKKGYYYYVGSAMNNLEKRIERHRRKNKKMHWHIDYFLKHGKITEVVKFKTNKRIECLLSRKIGKVADGFVKGFGCSDCRCGSHLYYLTNSTSGKPLNWMSPVRNLMPLFTAII